MGSGCSLDWDTLGWSLEFGLMRVAGLVIECCLGCEEKG